VAKVSLDGAAIGDWDTFHTACQEVFGFPEFYGRNMNAWVDCLSYLRDEENMSKFHLAADEILQIDVENTDALRAQAPEILEDLIFCVSTINERYEDYGEKPALHLVLL
jgi:RNAse (barnase) inhibitor barstar